MDTRRNFLQKITMASAVTILKPQLSYSIMDKKSKPADIIIGHNGYTYKVDKN